MAATFYGLGKLTVPVPGTPVALTLPASLNPTSVHAFLVEALPTNTGKVYVGLDGLDTVTLVNVLVVLPVPTANLLPTFSVSLTQAANALNLMQLRFDADVALDGVLVSALVA